MNKKNYCKFVGYAAIASIFILCIIYFGYIISLLSIFLTIIKPLIIGLAMAFIFNIIMVRFEKVYGRKSNYKFYQVTRRPFGILVSILAVVGIIGFVIGLVVPSLLDAITLLADNITDLYSNFINWITKYDDLLPIIGEEIGDIEIDWSSVGTEVMDFFKGGFSSIFGSTYVIITGTLATVVNIFMGFVFSIFVLASKEKLIVQVTNFINAYLPKQKKYILKVYKVSYKCFSAFIVGQFTEGIILGILCTIGLLILRIPYAVVIGVLIGFTALIPIAGAYIGGGIGFLLVLTESPIQALIFVIFLVVLQQLESNLIYPKVVGTSIGLPGIWVFMTVIIGGGLAGILGMLIGVPLMAVIYELVGENIKNQNHMKSISGQKNKH